LRHLAYILATAYHESAHTMQPCARWAARNTFAPSPTIHGCACAWEVNARKFGATAPGQLMTWPLALVAIFEGMTVHRRYPTHRREQGGLYRRSPHRERHGSGVENCWLRQNVRDGIAGGYGTTAHRQPRQARSGVPASQPSIIPDKPSVITITPQDKGPPVITVTPAQSEPTLKVQPPHRTGIVAMVILIISVISAYFHLG
jgi:hypothetical protein